MKQTMVNLRAANIAIMNIVDVVNAAIKALAPSGERFRCTSKVYDAKNIGKVYLSLDVMHHVAATASSDCGCPGQKPPPGPPSHLPFAPSTANIPEMKAWLLNWYAPSIFNKFPHQPLPRMDGPPVEIHLVEDDVSRKVAMPATIPLHWQEQVKADLECDVALGVIERMEEPSEWCQRMVCVHKAWLLNWYAP